MDRSSEIDDEEDEGFWSEWLKMSDAEQEAACQREMAALQKRITAMSPLEYYRWRRQLNVRVAKNWRKLSREFPDITIFKGYHRGAQHRLVQIRLRYYHGIEAGTS